MAEDITLDQVMARRFDLDEQIGIISGRHAAEVKPLKDEQLLCETYIKTELLKTGAQQWKSATTGHSTHFTTKSRCNVADFDAVIECVQKEGLWNLLTKAVSKEAVKEYIGIHNAPPPGVAYSEFKDLTWTRGKA